MFIKKILKKFVKVKKEKVLIPCLNGDLLNNKYAVITGGSSGIGYAIAKSFLNNKAHVIITGRDDNKLTEAKNNLIADCKVDADFIQIATLDLLDIKNIVIII